MQYTTKYNSPLGEIIIAADSEGITGLWFIGQKYFAKSLDKNNKEKDIPVLIKTKKWLDIYFSGIMPNFKLPIHFIGTDFQKDVWNILCEIPYGKTITYGEISKLISEKKKIKSMSSQAVGGAVGRNNISIIVPCHRVIGRDGNLTGYAGGIDRKRELLKLEKLK